MIGQKVGSHVALFGIAELVFEPCVVCRIGSKSLIGMKGFYGESELKPWHYFDCAVFRGTVEGAAVDSFRNLFS
jgi:hypothetical protein